MNSDYVYLVVLFFDESLKKLNTFIILETMCILCTI